MNLLYKYRSFSINSLEILIKQTLYFSETVNFNDPFDGQLLPIHFMSEMRELGYTGSVADIENANGFVKDRLMRLGVLSLSRRRDEILMWSHYADAHKGFCLGFTDDLAKSFLEVDWQVYREEVKYEELHPFKAILNASTIRSPSGDQFDNFASTALALLDAALTVKHASWAYEKEERIISEVVGLHTFNPFALVHIIFGLQSSQEDISILLALLENDRWKHVRIFQARRGKAALALEFEEISRHLK